MTNPFDRNFFKFFLGFILILLASFGLLYAVGTYSAAQNNTVTVLGN